MGRKLGRQTRDGNKLVRSEKFVAFLRLQGSVFQARPLRSQGHMLATNNVIGNFKAQVAAFSLRGFRVIKFVAEACFARFLQWEIAFGCDHTNFLVVV